MKERSFDEMIAYFNRRVADMDISQDYKMELFGIVTALGYTREKSAQQWTPCSERLPKKEDIYLVTFDKSSLLEGEYTVSDAYWIDDKWQYAMIEHYEHKMPKIIIEPIEELKIIAWAPLPEGYQGGRIA